MKFILISSLIYLFALNVNGQQHIDIQTNVLDGVNRQIANFENVANGNRVLLWTDYTAGSGAVTANTRFTTFHPSYTGSPNVGGYTGLTNDSAGIFLRTSESTGKVRFFIGTSTATSGIRMTVSDNGVGFGTDSPKTNVHVENGAMFVGINGQMILTSPNNNCWSIQVDNTGTLSSTGVTCP